MSKESVDLTNGDHFFFWKQLFNIAGINLFKSNRINQGLRILLHTISFFICVTILEKMIYTKCELLEAIYGIGFFMGYAVCLSMVFKRKQLTKMFDALESLMYLPDVRPQRTEEIKFVKEHSIYTNKIGLLSLCAVSTGIITPFTLWILYKNTKFPFGLFVEVINNQITTILQCIWFFMISTAYTLSDTAVFMVLSHVKFHLTNLKFCIQNLGVQDTEKDEENAVEWNYLKNRLKDVVTYHTAILDLAKLIDEAFHLSNLMKFIFLSLVLCLLMFGISKFRITDGLFLLQFFYVIFVLIQMNIVYYYGNEIIIQSQGIANCCYDVNFVGADIRLQKGLLLIIQRSQRPIQMTVRKFAPLSLATSIAIMRAAYSYFMVLRDLN